MRHGGRRLVGIGQQHGGIAGAPEAWTQAKHNLWSKFATKCCMIEVCVNSIGGAAGAPAAQELVEQ